MPAVIHSSRRVRIVVAEQCRVRNPFVGSTQDQDLDELVEHHAFRDPWPVATQRVGIDPRAGITAVN